MLARSFSAGLRAIRKRPGLAVLLFALDLALAFILSLAAAAIIGGELAPTGFSEALAREFDLVLWADLSDEFGAALGTILQQLVWVIPLWIIWKAIAHAGLVHALRGDAVRPFWQGVGRYAGRAVLLALLYVLALVGVAVVVGVVAVVLNLAWSGEVAAFWSNFVLVPTLLITLLAVLDLMHDYSRIALVVDERKVVKAFTTGITWPFRYGQASWLYWMWFLPGLVLVLLPVWLDMAFVAATALGMWGLFLLQQVVLLARSAVTVGWIGSETALYEAIRMQEAPLIAEDDEREPAPAESGAGADTAVPSYEPPESDTPGLASA
jgi:hypothetical protein